MTAANSPTARVLSDEEIDYAVRVADAANGLAGHEVTDEGREIVRRGLRGAGESPGMLTDLTGAGAVPTGTLFGTLPVPRLRQALPIRRAVSRPTSRA